MIVHLIVNSHLDPVWLWKREQGIDEVLATARTACEVLEEFPEVHITRGEVWFYETVQEIDPALFRRIRKHVDSGRWHIVGNWYVQPDCNLAAPETYLQHGRIGNEYFAKYFNVKVRTGFNVDSFGHGAMLPDFYTTCGVENYVYMRPMPHEMTGAPPNTFLWETPSGNALKTFRISRAYCTVGLDPVEQVRNNLTATLADTPNTQEHTMCFVGVGDHGGGPTREEIRWLREHLHAFPGVELRFSHPDAFFEAVKRDSLPRYRGELQHHAIGCYSAVSRIKRELRQTEERLLQAERFVPGLVPAEREAAWKKLLFATFHDVLPGSAIRSAYDGIYDDLGGVRSWANGQIVRTIRRRNTELAAAPCQRLIFDNTGDQDFSGMVEFEPWAGYVWVAGTVLPEHRLTDESGAVVPHQRIRQEALNPLLRYIVPLEIPAHGRRVLLMHTGKTDAAPGSAATNGTETGNSQLAVSTGTRGIASLRYHGKAFLADSFLAVCEDRSDTWSHCMSAYAVEPEFRLDGAAWKTLENDPSAGLIAATIADLSGADLRLQYVVSVEHEESCVRLRFRINWNQRQKLLKLCIRPAFTVERRLDGCPGGAVERKLNGEEYPMFRFSLLEGTDRALAVISQDVFGCDVQPDGMLRLTLLRSPYYAHHDTTQTPVPEPNFAAVTDQGEHEFEILLLPLETADLEMVRGKVFRGTNPIRFSEVTSGMGRLSSKAEYP